MPYFGLNTVWTGLDVFSAGACAHKIATEFNLFYDLAFLTTRDQVRDLQGNYSRPRPRSYPFGLETKTKAFEKWTRVHSSHETLVSRSQNWLAYWSFTALFDIEWIEH